MKISEKALLATIRASPRINADDKAPSYGLFLTYRGEKYVQYYTVIQQQFYYANNTSKKNINAKSYLLGMGAIIA
jgi:hypothetical protein